MNMATNYVDYNRENILKALFKDLQKELRIPEMSERAKLIREFVVNGGLDGKSPCKEGGGILIPATYDLKHTIKYPAMKKKDKI